MKKSVLLVGLAVMAMLFSNVSALSVETNDALIKKALRNPDAAKERILQWYQNADLQEINELLVNDFKLIDRNMVHSAKGRYGSGYFKGIDSNGDKFIGIYGENLFLGVYLEDHHFFVGKKDSGKYAAKGLYHKARSRGIILT